MTADAETRAEVLAEVREVLALLKEQAARPLVRFDAPASDCLQAVPSVPWEAPPTSTPEKDMLEALRAHHAGGACLTLPEGLTVQRAGPTPAMLGLLERLAYLLGLSDLEREFFTACASGEIMDAFDGRLAYADWLEERGDTAGAVRVRELTPRPGDVLLGTLPGEETARYSVPPEWDACVNAVHSLQGVLRRRGVETTEILLPPGATLENIDEAQMAERGWVRAERLAGEGQTASAVTARAMAAWRRAEDARVEAYGRLVRTQLEAYLSAEGSAG